MSEHQKSMASSLFTFLGGLSGLISISLIIWQGGQLYQRVEYQGKRLDVIETVGSIGLREHVKVDDERVADIRMRVADQALRMMHQEETATRILEIMGDIKALNVKLDNLKEQIKVKP